MVLGWTWQGLVLACVGLVGLVFIDLVGLGLFGIEFVLAWLVGIGRVGIDLVGIGLVGG